MWAYPWTVIPPTTVRLLTSGKLPAALLSLYLWVIKPACCGAEIDVDSTAFVSSLANSKSIFLTFFYLLSSHNLPLCPPSLLLLYLCYSSVHLYSAQTWVSPIASISYLVIFFPRFFLCCVSPAGLAPSICLFFCISLHPPPSPPICSWSPFTSQALSRGYTYSGWLELYESYLIVCGCGIIQIFEGFLESKSDKTAIKPDGNSQGGAAALSLPH